MLATIKPQSRNIMYGTRDGRVHFRLPSSVGTTSTTLMFSARIYAPQPFPIELDLERREWDPPPSEGKNGFTRVEEWVI